MRKLFKLVGVIALDGLQKAEKQIAGLEKNVRKAIKPIQRLGRQLEKTGKDFTAAFTVPLTIAGGAVIKFGADFEKAMTNSLAIMGDVSDEMKTKMSDAAREVAKTSTFGAEKAAEAYFFLASAGFTAAQSIEALPRVTAFAQAGNFELALATDLLTDAQSALGLSSDDTAESIENMTRVSDVLVMGNSLANASVQQLSESITNKAGAALRQLGKDVEEGVAVLLAFADQGSKGKEAGEKLNIVLRDLQKAAIENKKAFVEAGIAVFDSSGEMNNMADIIEDLENRLAGMSDEQRKMELSQLGFQEKSIAATAALLGTSKAIRQYEIDLEAAALKTDEVAQKQLNSFSNQMTIVKHLLIDVALEFAEVLLPILKDHVIPVFKDVAKWLGKVAEWFSNLSPAMQKTIIAFTAFLTLIGPVMIAVGKLIGIIKIAISVLSLAKAAVLAFNVVLNLNPIFLVITAIGLLVTAGVLLYKNWGTVTKGFIWYWDLIVYRVEQAISYMKTLILEFVKKHIEAIEIIGQYIPKLNKSLESARWAIEDLINAEEDGREAKKLLREEIKLAAIETESLAEVTEKAKKNTEEATKSTKDLTKKTTEQILAEKALTEAREKHGKDWAKQLKDQSLAVKEETMTKLEFLNFEHQEALKVAEELGADRASVDQFYKVERMRLAREEKEEKDKLIADANAAAEERAMTQQMKIAEDFEAKSILLEEEYLREIEQAEKIGADVTAIQDFYKAKRIELAKEEEDKKSKLRKKGLREEKNIAKIVYNVIKQSISKIFSLYSKHTDNKLKQLDMDEENQKKAVMKSTLSEEEKQLKIGQIEEKAEEKRKALKRKKAISDKAGAIFSAVISTFEAAAKALTAGPILGPILASIIGGLGAVQVGMIAAEPLPELAEGGLAQRRRGGTKVIVGEGGDDEAILPMKKGAFAIADRVFERIASTILPAQALPTLASSGGGSIDDSGSRDAVQNHWHIGTLVADDAGIKELERRQLSFRVAEAKRKGED